MKRLDELGVLPAPWTCNTDKPAVYDKDGRCVADCEIHFAMRKDIADARLIAAAPSLYEALTAMLSCAEKNAPYLDMSHMEIAMDMARKAIRQAGGEE